MWSGLSASSRVAGSERPKRVAGSERLREGPVFSKRANNQSGAFTHDQHNPASPSPKVQGNSALRRHRNKSTRSQYAVGPGTAPGLREALRPGHPPDNPRESSTAQTLEGNTQPMRSRSWYPSGPSRRRSDPATRPSAAGCRGVFETHHDHGSDHCNAPEAERVVTCGRSRALREGPVSNHPAGPAPPHVNMRLRFNTIRAHQNSCVIHAPNCGLVFAR